MNSPMLSTLQHFFDKGIIHVKEKNTTLFDIAGFPHYENVVSNVYAHFFDPAKDHGLGSLFIDSLQELLSTDFKFASPKIIRECYSEKGGRIDLVIQNIGSTSENSNPENDQPVILIENKINHDVNNDFEDYYNSFECSQKQGVLLTIRPVRPSHPGFINITHDQLIKNIFKNIGDRVMNAPYRSIFTLNEFSKNLKNFTMEHEVANYYDFYLKNKTSIQQVEKLKSELITHMWKQIESVPELLPDLNLTIGNNYSGSLRCYKSNITDEVYFTIYPQFFDNENSRITIVVELNRNGIERLDEINKIPFTEEEKSFFKDTSAIRSTWLHYASKLFEVKLVRDFDNLSEFIHDKIESTPLKSIFLKIHRALTS